MSSLNKNKIYTRTGDKGNTGLTDGRRINKSSLRICVLGDIDELNSLLGVVDANNISNKSSFNIREIQSKLFVIGSEISLLDNIIISQKDVKSIEEYIDLYNSKLPKLRKFVFPNGTVPATFMHLSRSVCRRCERNLVNLSQTEFVNKYTLSYINRLSDLLFVIARYLNKNKETLWDGGFYKSVK